MAATAVYADLRSLPSDATSHEQKLFENIGVTTNAFPIRGGLYVMKIKASTYGTVTLQVLGPDGVTWLNALAGVTADGTSAGYLAPDNYRIELT